MSSLEYFDKYWRTVSSRQKTVYEELKGGETIGGQHPMIQNNHLENLKQLCDNAGIDDWVTEIDHRATYHSNKQKILDRYGGQGFETDQEAVAARGEAEQKKREEQAPDNAPASLEEQMRQQAGGNNRTPDNVEVESIGGNPNTSSNQKGSTANNSNNSRGGQQSQGSNSTSSLSLSQVRSRCLEAIEEAYEETEPILIDALPGTGKSYAAVEAASTTEAPITIATSRGRKGRYSEIESWCQKHGLSNKVLPSADDSCPTFKGKHGTKLEQKFKRYRRLGVTASDLHEHWNPPCQEDGVCPYQSNWDFQPEDYDVLIGHYLHLHVEKIIENRVVVIDESPSDDFLTEFKDPQETIANFLKQTSNIPFNNHYNLVTNSDPDKEEQALDWFENKGIDLADSKQILNQSTEDYHIWAPLLVLGTLVSRDLNNDWGTAALGGGQVFAHDRNRNEMHVLTPPNLTGATNIVALDGTPTIRLYDLIFGLNFQHKQLLSDSEREEYILDTQDLRIIQTEFRSIHPYSSGTYVNLDRDEALLREVIEVEGGEPAVITSSDALGKLKARNVPMSPNSSHYGNLRGSNELANENVGVILGSPHYGDKFIERWAALFGLEASGSGSGTAKSYGPFGDEILQQMRDNSVLQAILRFARNGTGATVYVNTAAVPPWIPREIALGVSRTRPATERKIIDALSDLGTASGPDIAKKVGGKKNTVRSNLRKLQAEGIVRKTGNNRGTKWHDNGLSNANRYGLVDLSSITNKTYKIPIREIGDKTRLKEEMDKQLEQYNIDQAERSRLINDKWMTDRRS
ncbi:winged helix-turn-helix domain-containing protein [Halomicrococcus gelatinilyticus]|uniref:winged helix-turn-helix domain-containing protein n=1 Tax=Halomicrococcus gelatinilyticus TaxID=1702103 RepID=UPI002E118761